MTLRFLFPKNSVLYSMRIRWSYFSYPTTIRPYHHRYRAYLHSPMSDTVLSFVPVWIYFYCIGTLGCKHSPENLNLHSCQGILLSWRGPRISVSFPSSNHLSPQKLIVFPVPILNLRPTTKCQFILHYSFPKWPYACWVFRFSPPCTLYWTYLSLKF